MGDESGFDKFERTTTYGNLFRHKNYTQNSVVKIRILIEKPRSSEESQWFSSFWLCSTSHCWPPRFWHGLLVGACLAFMFLNTTQNVTKNEYLKTFHVSDIPSLISDFLFNAASPSPKATISPHSNSLSWDEGQLKFRQFLIDLKLKYVSQTSLTRNQIFRAVSSTMEPTVPKQPSCITLLSPPTSSSAHFGPCFAHKMASSINSIFQQIEDSGMSHSSGPVLQLTSNDLKGKTVDEIHAQLDLYLSGSGKAVVMTTIEELNSEELLNVLHAYCDNTQAPDKRATFFFPVTVPANLYSKFEWSADNGPTIAHKIFNEAWTSLRLDKRPAMVTRVTETVVLLNDGDECAT